MNIIFGILIYMAIGSLLVAAMRFSDRHIKNGGAPFFSKNLDVDEVSMVIIVWPLFVVLFIILWGPYLFYKILATIVTTIIYTIKAMVAGGDDEKQRETDQSTE